MNPYKSTRKYRFISDLPQVSLDDPKLDIKSRCKFNFSYFDNSQDAGQDFKDWSKDQLVKFLIKLKDYSQKSLQTWKTTKTGKGKNHILEEYGSFPRISDFVHPKHVPHQASWARFRLESSVRLIGFMIPEDYMGKFDRNTFYIVFLDKDHRFYKSKK